MSAYVCPDCGKPIERVDSGGWWRHVGLNGECWRLSLDGPNMPYGIDQNDNDVIRSRDEG